MSVEGRPTANLSSDEKRALLARLLAEKRDAPQTFPLSFSQTRLWFLDRFDPGDPSYNIPLAIRLPGPLDVAALEASVNEIVRRHDALRTTFDTAGGRPVQVVAPSLKLPIQLVDLRALAHATREQEAARLAAEEARTSFDLMRGPLMRVTLLRLGDLDHLLVVVMHHIVSDAWSMTVLFDELSALCVAYTTGRPSPLPELPIQYADYATWQAEWLRGEVLERELAYWRSQLAGVRPVLDLPTRAPRPALQTHSGAVHAFVIEAAVLKGLHALGRREGATLFMTLLAAFKTLLHRYTLETDIALGSPIANRTRPELEQLIGFFVNTLVLRTDLSGDPTFCELLARVRNVTLDAYAHQDVPFEKLVEELNVDRNLGQNPLFQIMFAVQNVGSPAAGGTGDPPASGAPVISNGTAKFDLTLSVSETKDGASGVLEYNTDLFSALTARELVERFTVLLRAVVETPESRLSAFDLRVSGEDVGDPFGALAADAAVAPLVSEAVAARAAFAPDALAVVDDVGELTYAELESASRRLAARLRGLGLDADAVVAAYVEPSTELAVAALAGLRTGILVLLDPEDPVARLRAIVDDAAPALVMTTAALRSRLPHDGPPVLVLDDAMNDDAVAADLEQDTGQGAARDRIACIAYRSGTDGAPEGILLTERAISRTTVDADLHINEQDCVAQTMGVSSDAACLALFGALAAGARTRLLGSATIRAPRRLAVALRDDATTILCAPGAVVERLAREFPWGLRSLRALLCVDRAAGLDRLREALSAGASLPVFAVYGATEAAGWCTACALADATGATGGPRLGATAPDTRAYLLDAHGEPVPRGIIGEVYVAGEALAIGYHRRGARTAASFVPHARSGAPGRRLHRTGDLGRRGSDGLIELRGRRDGRVAIRGARVHLEEIEEALRACPGVADAAVALRDLPEARDPWLIALVVTDRAEAPAEAEIRTLLAVQLPDAMIPRIVRAVVAIPRTASGGVDRRAVAELEAAVERRETAPEHVAPRDEVEERLADIWAETVGLDHRPGIHDSFFRLGGHSLLATRVVARASEAFGVQLSLRDFFEAPTIAGFASAVARPAGPEARTGGPELVRIPRDRPLPLSFAQQRLWFLAQMEPDSAFYNIPAPVRLPGPIDVNALRAAINALVARHEALRTTFTIVADEPVQVIAPALILDVPLRDLSGLSPQARQAEAARLADLEARRLFDLARGPLIRAELLRLAPVEHILLLTVHHVIADGWSMDVFFRELGTLHEAHRSGREPALPELEVQYADFAAWQRQVLTGPVLERQVDYWKRQLEDAPPVLNLPTDRPRPAVQTYSGAVHTFSLPGSLLERVRALSEREGVTLFMTLLATFKAMLHRYTGQRDIVVGTPVANRGRPELEGLIGFFANTLVLRTDVAAEVTFRELIARVREVTLGAYAHQDLPFERLVEDLQPQRSLAHNPLFQVMFALQNTGGVRAPAAVTSGGTPTFLGTGVAKFDLTVFLVETTDGMDAGIEFNSDLFDAATVARMAGHFEAMLAAAAADPDQPIASAPMLSRPELLALSEWNATEVERPSETLQSLFRAQVKRTPDVEAVSFHGRELSYRELDERADAVAARLVASGVAPDTCVGISTERSIDMIVAVLATLKAGGACVPLDPAYPADRRAFMVRDADIRAIVTQAHLLGTLPTTEARAIVVDDDPEAAGAPAHRPAPICEDHLAYVLYTSGSTGRPKGVGMPQRSLTNLVRWQAERTSPRVGARTLQFASLSFDVSFQEIFCTLCTGGTLVLVGDDERRDPRVLWDVLARERIERLFLPYVALQQLAEAAPDPLPTCALHEVVTAGEQLQITPAIRRLFSALTCPLYNQYGPTETHVVTEHALMPPAAAWPVLPPIGRPVANATVHVLDAHRNALPVGVPGELYLGGRAVSRGYIGRPQLTGERFVPDPEGAPGSRLYRTGDRGRRAPDGAIEFLGRFDDQVKIRGFRVEPGEIEALLREHPAVREAAVATCPSVGEQRLAAYVQSAPGAAVTAPELQAHLRALVPEHMVPGTFLLLDAMPLTPTGKLDRRALPDAAAPASRGEAAAPRTPAEEALARIWCKLLGIERVGVHDDFFELGGHSLLATRVISRIAAELDVDIPLRRLFECPTIEQLALAILQASLAAEDEDETAKLLAELDEMPDDDERSSAAP